MHAGGRETLSNIFRHFCLFSIHCVCSSVSFSSLFFYTQVEVVRKWFIQRNRLPHWTIHWASSFFFLSHLSDFVNRFIIIIFCNSTNSAYSSLSLLPYPELVPVKAVNHSSIISLNELCQVRSRQPRRLLQMHLAPLSSLTFTNQRRGLSVMKLTLKWSAWRFSAPYFKFSYV